jgi:hypothetical protein
MPGMVFAERAGSKFVLPYPGKSTGRKNRRISIRCVANLILKKQF